MKSRMESRILLFRVMNPRTLGILDVLAKKPTRFNQLRRDMGSIPQRTLSQALKMLEEEGYVRRCVSPAAPVSVEYSVTAQAKEFLEAAEGVRNWVQSAHRPRHALQVPTDDRV